MVLLLSIILIVSLGETLYLLLKIRNLRKSNASDKEYEKMISNYTPLGIATLVISIVILAIAFIF
ncbi:hypothetical protein CD113_03405 [Staphylococcus simiae]|uniref:Uncharacterized protein n=1 Tax=Staphylococcus simiae CCM 7213 = CCUG 51256 TaxID=911238 RepID=G5JFX8_9STAP|nr:hypothetical protein SS7213T_01711 [Staphylococcus simiae CCM 7213 = CCUG 51256]PNZ13999.1 hypothetical protein CD113_03405 [Staphylococcus simiae]SNV65164.1 Uncharacterised protein [Staphylococcus simiae]